VNSRVLRGGSLKSGISQGGLKIRKKIMRKIKILYKEERKSERTKKIRVKRISKRRRQR